MNRFTLISIIISICACMATAGPQTGKHSTTQRSMEAMPSMPIVAPLFIENGQLTTSVTVINSMARATTVDIVLLNQNGSEIARQTYPLAGHGQKVVRVGDVLQAANSATFFGSVKIETDSDAEMNMAVLAQASITGIASGVPVYLEEEFPMSTPSDSGVLRAAAPAGLGFPVLALRSTSANSQTVTLTCVYEHGGRSQTTLELAPAQMALSGACAAGREQLASLSAGWNQQTLDSKGATGISVTSTGGPGALCVYGFLMTGQATKPIYASLNFTDAGAENTGTTVFTGVPVGHAEPLGSDNFVPMLALANFGTTPVTATVTHAVTDASGPHGNTLTTITIAGQSSATVPIATLNGDPQMRNSFVVSSNAAKGALYAGMMVLGEHDFGTVQFLGKDRLEPYNAGVHPWTTSGANSTLFLFNYTSTVQPFRVAIGASDTLWQQMYNLAPLETKLLDINALIATGVKDQNGVALPRDATAGIVNWFTPTSGEGAGRLMVSSSANGMARSFSCQNTTTYCGTSSLLNNNITVISGSSGQMGPYQVDFCASQIPNCSGTYQQTVAVAANWTSSNSSVASLTSGSNNNPYATINGGSPGSATITATTSPQQQYNPSTGMYYYCYAAQQSGTTTVCAVPKNFQLTNSYATTYPSGSTPAGNSLFVAYSWQSTSGNLSDLSGCKVREWVAYPGGNPYAFPSPFPAVTQSNPYDGGGPGNYFVGSEGGAGDIHSPWGSTQQPFVKPYSANSFTATQVYQYSCPCSNNGAWTTFTPTFSIVRTVSSNGDGTWKYVLTKTGASAQGTINPLP